MLDVVFAAMLQVTGFDGKLCDRSARTGSTCPTADQSVSSDKAALSVSLTELDKYRLVIVQEEITARS